MDRSFFKLTGDLAAGHISVFTGKAGQLVISHNAFI